MAPCPDHRPSALSAPWVLLEAEKQVDCNKTSTYQVQVQGDALLAPFAIKDDACDIDSCMNSDPHKATAENAEENYDIISERAWLQSRPPPAAAAQLGDFPEAEVQPWQVGQFRKVKELQDATRNFGKVVLMKEAATGEQYAVKCLPNHWMQRNEAEFIAAHPGETEKPWRDLATLRYLERHSFPYLCALHGVFRDANFTFVAMTYASEGDLFSWCEKAVAPGPQREILAQRLVRQVAHAVQLLHNLGIVHGDVSLENTLVTKDGDSEELRVCLIDFGASSTKRFLSTAVDGFMGKVSYQAPEMHTGQLYDGFLADEFALGVLAFSTVMNDYPWLSTIPEGCKCFTYFQEHGFQAYMRKRKVRGGSQRFQEVTSPDLQTLLRGLLELDPAQRMSLGEDVFVHGSSQRRSAWDLSWLSGTSNLAL
mmetsp:Transcript_65398/g.156380  ORF Transcript_65398/g.156380 Transcript_65398/m.156380 type:complete len:424 (-) Transcript_65398:208-1479(-)